MDHGLIFYRSSIRLCSRKKKSMALIFNRSGSRHWIAVENKCRQPNCPMSLFSWHSWECENPWSIDLFGFAACNNMDLFKTFTKIPFNITHYCIVCLDNDVLSNMESLRQSWRGTCRTYNNGEWGRDANSNCAICLLLVGICLRQRLRRQRIFTIDRLVEWLW